MDGFKLFHRLHLKNILSYGPKAEPIDLEPLNVLIGPNGSGKSNLIEAISLLKAAPADVSAPIRGSGFFHWLWKGRSGDTPEGPYLDVDVDYPAGRRPLTYGLVLRSEDQATEVAAEVLWDRPNRGVSADFKTFSPGGENYCEKYYYFDFDKGEAKIAPAVTGNADSLVQERPKQVLHRKQYNPSKSVLAQIRDPRIYPEITYVGSAFSQIALFRGIGLGPESKLRGPHRADEPASFLLEDGRNLGVVLSDLLNQPSTKKQILKELQRFYAPVEDITTKTYANTVELSLHECGLTQSVPSIRLSDGTLRYLALLTILCHPKPPPLVCIEDPEVGLHPDILPHLADLLVEASQRMQLIVTTHSDIIVSALSHVPEAVVVCERDDEGTHLRRLDAASLHQWLKKYTLGELWSMGELGGNP